MRAKGVERAKGVYGCGTGDGGDHEHASEHHRPQQRLALQPAQGAEEEADQHGQPQRQQAGLAHLLERRRRDDGDALVVVGQLRAVHDAWLLGELATHLRAAGVQAEAHRLAAGMHRVAG